MKKQFRRLSLVVLIIFGITTLLAGCGGGKTTEQPNTTAASTASTEAATSEVSAVSTKDPNAIDTSKEVNLKMLFVGDKVADQDLVYDEVNKLAKKDLNCTVNIKNLSWADYQQQYPLVLASGEEMDLVYAGEWLGYFDQARKGAFHEITTADIEKYMSVTAKEQEAVSFDQAKVDGKLYMIPNYQFEYNVYRVVGIRSDLGAKYGITEVKTVDDLEAYSEAIVKNEKGIIPIANEGSGGNDNFALFFKQPNNYQIVGATGGINLFAVKFTNGSFDYNSLFNIYSSLEYAAYAQKMADWGKKGFWSKNAASGKGKINDNFVAGKSAVDEWHVGGVGGDAEKILQKQPDWKIDIIDLNPESFKTISKFTNNGVAISVNTQNFERSLMLLEKFKNDQNYFELTNLGIKGKNWIDAGERKFKQGPDYTKFPIYGTSMWGWMSEKFRRNSETQPVQMNEMIAKWKDSVVYPVTDNFVFDDTKVKSEYAAVSNLVKTYVTIFDLGMSRNVEATLKEFNDKMQKAGLAKVEEEFKSQYNTFIQANVK